MAFLSISCLKIAPTKPQHTLQCLLAVAERERPSEACRRLEPQLRPQMAYLGADAAWHRFG